MTLEDAALAFPVGARVEWLEWEWMAEATIAGVPVLEGDTVRIPCRIHTNKIENVGVSVLLTGPDDVLALRREIVRLRAGGSP